MAASSILVDCVFDDASPHEIGRHDDNGDEEGDERDHGCEERAEEARAESEEEGDEGEAACDGVQDHDSRQRVRGVARGSAEARPVDLGHDGSGIVANCPGVAEILVGPAVC